MIPSVCGAFVSDYVQSLDLLERDSDTKKNYCSDSLLSIACIKNIFSVLGHLKKAEEICARTVCCEAQPCHEKNPAEAAADISKAKEK